MSWIDGRRFLLAFNLWISIVLSSALSVLLLIMDKRMNKPAEVPAIPPPVTEQASDALAARSAGICPSTVPCEHFRTRCAAVEIQDPIIAWLSSLILDGTRVTKRDAYRDYVAFCILEGVDSRWKQRGFSLKMGRLGIETVRASKSPFFIL